MDHQNRQQPYVIQQVEHQKSKTIGNYVLGKTLGKGTFGKVKLAQHILTGEKVAIKILEKDRIIDVSDVERVSREIHILKLIRHPNIIQLYQIIETPKQLFLVMQYMQNGQLFDYIVKNKKIPEIQACRIFKQIISGIQYIHKLNIVHRDLKPENLLLDYDLTVRIVDFGLSNTYKKDQTLKTACGSPCYAAPEMIEGKKKYQALMVDIWSCGVILFAMLCGSLPFEDKSTAKLYRKILSGQYKVPNFLSFEAKDLLSKILTVNPEKRYRIEDIRKHKWWQISPTNTCSDGLIVGYHKIPIDYQILQQLKSLNFDIDLVQKCLQANRHNNLTTTYYLLLKKHLKQGGTSKADLGSKFFDKTLIQPNKRREKHDSLTGKQFIMSNNKKYSLNNLNNSKTGDNQFFVQSPQKSPNINNLKIKDKKTKKSMNQFNASRSKQQKRGLSSVKKKQKKNISLNETLKNKNKQKYGESLVTKSGSKSRKKSLRANQVLINDKLISYHFPNKIKVSKSMSYKVNSKSLRDKKDSNQMSYQAQLQHYGIGMDTPYSNHLVPKWRHNNSTNNSKGQIKEGNKKPHIKRRSLYH